MSKKNKKTSKKHNKRPLKEEPKHSAISGAKHKAEPVTFEHGKVTFHVHKHPITKNLLLNSVRFVMGVLILGFMFILPTIQSPKATEVLGSAAKNSVFKKELQKEPPMAPQITATSAIIVSTKKNKILYAKNIDQKLPPASTTKILTALMAIREFDLNEEVLVPDACTKVESSKMGLVANEHIDVESLLYGLLVSSAGDAACTLSVHKFSSGAFIVKMNQMAQELGLSHTVFNNPIGLDAGDSQLSSARDLYLMAKEAMKNGTFRKIVGTKDIVLYNTDKTLSHHLITTNKLLLEVPGTLGVKTGTTPHAKEVLVYAYEKKGDELIIVVMGSDNRFEDTKKLLDYTLENYNSF